MTSQLRRKRRTTARPTPSVRTACKLAVLAVLAGPVAFAQQPYRPAGGPPATFGSPYPAQTYSGAASSAYVGQVQQWSNVPPAQAAAPTNGGLPPGYRLAGGSRQAPPPAADRTGM